MSVTTGNRLDGYDAAEQRRGRLIDVADRMADIAGGLGLGALADSVAAASARVRSDAFVVTVLGDFNSGKSTLINALLGADALPRLPVACTALLTEVKWGDQPEAWLYRRTADGGIATEPERAEIGRLRELIVIDVDEPDTQSPYARAEVHWPLELCRNNVRIVDSPGLNEDEIREKLTMSYLQRTDAVVFVLDAKANMKRNEVEFMQAHLDAHEPFFVLNFINQIPVEEHDLVRRSAAVRLHKARPNHHGDSERMHWVDARSGLLAREGADTTAWEASGVARLQRDLERFLTTERHKVKILAPARQLRLLRREAVESIDKQTAMLAESLDELARRYAEAQVPLQRLEQDADRITRDLANRIGDLQEDVARRIEGKLRLLASDVVGFAMESIPDSKLSVKPWKTAEQATAVAGEVAEVAARSVQAAFTTWVTSELQPVLEDRIARLSGGLDAEMVSFEHELDVVRVDMSGVASTLGTSAVKDGETALSRILAGGAGIVTAAPAAALSGARFGPREMAKSLLPTIAIGVAWMFTPIGWAVVLAAALVGQAIFGRFSALKGAEKKIKQKVGEEMAHEMRGRAHEDARQAAARLGAQLDEVRAGVAAGLDTQLSTFRQEVEAVLGAKRAGESAAQLRRAELRRLGEQLKDTMDQLEDIVDEIAAL